MAEIIREDYHLPALRLSLQFVNREPMVLIRAYHGRRALAEEEIPADQIGIGERLSVGNYQKVKFNLPNEIIARLDQVLQEVRRDEPVWLQIDRSSGFLAVVPWERLLGQVMSGPILRIPNFLVDPVIVKDPLTLVLCASSPAAKEFFSVYGFTCELIGQVQQAVAQGTEIHVFADAVAYDFLRGRFDGHDREGHQVTIYNPEKAMAFGDGASDLSESVNLRSPWLRWMEAELGELAVDAVHFLCPGYFQTERGSLALARSPVANVDEWWSHFIGAPELCTFLNELGAGAVVLGAPHETVWTLGLRLLADELAWTRPGPVMLYETQSNLQVVGRAYAFLFSASYAPPPQEGEILLYCHPRRLERYSHPVFSLESPTLSTADPGHEWLSSTMKAVRRQPEPRDYFAIPKPSEPRWAKSNQLIIEQSLMELRGQQGDAARGAAEALRFLSKLQADYLGEEK